MPELSAPLLQNIQHGAVFLEAADHMADALKTAFQEVGQKINQIDDEQQRDELHSHLKDEADAMLRGFYEAAGNLFQRFQIDTGVYLGDDENNAASESEEVSI